MLLRSGVWYCAVAVSLGLLCGCADTDDVSPTDSPIPRVVFIGLDSADWKTVQRLLRSDDLPNLDRIRRRGAFGSLATPRDALTLMALVRIFAWVIGDYAYLGNALRGEAAIFLMLALAFVWLRPPALPEVAAGPQAAGG